MACSSSVYRTEKAVLDLRKPQRNSKTTQQQKIAMSNDDEGPFTTNAEDQGEALKLKQRLASASEKSSQSQSESSAKGDDVPSVTIANGAHKYVLISAEKSGKKRDFVVSRRGAAYHRNAAEPMVYTLETHGYRNIEIKGGGRIHLDEVNNTISIFGFSYGFGAANHAVSKYVIEHDERYKGYTITISDDGY